MGTRRENRLLIRRTSQAVRTHPKFQMQGDEAEIQRRGNTLVIRPEKQTWQPLKDSLTMFTADFMEDGRQQPPVQKRKRPFA